MSQDSKFHRTNISHTQNVKGQNFNQTQRKRTKRHTDKITLDKILHELSNLHRIIQS